MWAFPKAAVTNFHKQWVKTTLRFFSSGAGGQKAMRGQEGCHLLEVLGENTFPLPFQLPVAPDLLGFPRLLGQQLSTFLPLTSASTITPPPPTRTLPSPSHEDPLDDNGLTWIIQAHLPSPDPESHLQSSFCHRRSRVCKSWGLGCKYLWAPWSCLPHRLRCFHISEV